MAFSDMTGRPTNTLKTEQLDMESFFDFNAGTQPSPVTASSSKTDAVSPFDTEDRPQFNGPSHDYGQFKQQVGLPGGSMANMPMSQSNGLFDGFNSGFGDMDFNGSNMSWNSGLDMDTDITMDFNSSMAPMFFPSSSDNQQDKFVNPSNVAAQDEPTSSVGRLWPGMHSQQAQQAAMAKAAQVQAVQQRQMKLQAQQAQYRQASQSSQSSSQGSSQQGHATAKRGSHIAEPHVEESISRLLNQMRQNNSASQDDSSSPNGIPSQIARLKKDEDDMDEDERLLASEEGKKLSSKERRQLRNKVSARAFRSRRKEYISQLEGEVAIKTQEANNLLKDNQALMQENERYRGLIETLLRHPAFTPFINDISKDPSVLGMPQQMPQPRQQMQQPQPQRHQQSQNSPQEPQQQQQQQPQQQQQEMKPDFMNFDPSQLQIPQQGEQIQVGMTMVPDNDFSKLNLNGFKSMNFNNFNVQSAYAVTDVPAGPDPVDLLTQSSARLLRSTNASSTANSSDSSLIVLLAKLDITARRMKDSVTACDV